MSNQYIQSKIEHFVYFSNLKLAGIAIYSVMKQMFYKYLFSRLSEISLH